MTIKGDYNTSNVVKEKYMLFVKPKNTFPFYFLT